MKKFWFFAGVEYDPLLVGMQYRLHVRKGQHSFQQRYSLTKRVLAVRDRKVRQHTRRV